MAKEMSFEQAINGLQKCVHELEEGSLTLEETIKRYEEGKKLVLVCKTRLDNAKLRITKVRKYTEEKDDTEGKEDGDGRETADVKEDPDGKKDANETEVRTGKEVPEEDDEDDDESEDAAKTTKQSYNSM